MAAMAYMDSSAIVKRYIEETGSQAVEEAYSKTLSGELKLSFSAWNIGEVLGVFDKYSRRGWLNVQEREMARRQFMGETVRLLRLDVLKVVPVKTRLLAQAWPILERYQIYQADALQLVSACQIKAEEFYTADERLHEIATKVGLQSFCVH
ncbi:MAG: type II toxin-antitoxin system VapC family toxin [Candidatus Verstraetearchaeota archaeon]|nr:type II toxin-antitoxin system VapC family toxin [Candidatus Verstraetearchaeota archaeon]